MLKNIEETDGNDSYERLCSDFIYAGDD